MWLIFYYKTLLLSVVFSINIYPVFKRKHSILWYSLDKVLKNNFADCALLLSQYKHFVFLLKSMYDFCVIIYLMYHQIKGIFMSYLRSAGSQQYVKKIKGYERTFLPNFLITCLTPNLLKLYSFNWSWLQFIKSIWL